MEADMLPRITTIQEDIEHTRAELVQAKDRLRHALSVDEQIECRLEIGRCTQQIRRLEREKRDGC